MTNIEQLIDKVKQYRKLEKTNELFTSELACKNPTDHSKEILRTYASLTEWAYVLTDEDKIIKQRAELAYPATLDNIRKRLSSDPKNGVKPSDLGIEGLDD